MSEGPAGAAHQFAHLKLDDDGDGKNSPNTPRRGRRGSVVVCLSEIHLNPQRTHDCLETADRLYHLGLDSDMDLPALFGDLRSVVMCGSADRAEAIAEYLVPVIHAAQKSAGDAEAKKPPVLGLGKRERYALFKVGPVLVCSHGMGGNPLSHCAFALWCPGLTSVALLQGAPSILIILNELVKLVEDAGLQPKEVEFIRVGTCGGVGVPPGTCVITTSCLNSELQAGWRFVELGKASMCSAEASESVVESLVLAGERIFEHEKRVVKRGKTMTTEDFYAGQGRLDGALSPWYNAQERRAFLQQCSDLGVLNIEMEAAPMLAFCRRAGVPAGCVAVTLLDRLSSQRGEDGAADQVAATSQELGDYQRRAIRIAAEHVRRRIAMGA